MGWKEEVDFLDGVFSEFRVEVGNAEVEVDGG